MKIAIASITTPEMKDLSDMTFLNKIDYCKKNGYAGALLTQVEPYYGFDKILFVEGLLKTNKFDYVFWCDCDTLFTNYNKKIEEIIDEKHHFFICSDYSKDINAGVFIVKNSDQGLSYIKTVKEKMYELAPINKFKFGEEQTALMATWRNEEYKDVIKIVPQKNMNAYPYTDKFIRDHRHCTTDALGLDGNWQYGDFLVHIPGFGPDLFHQRLNHFRKYMNLVIK